MSQTLTPEQRREFKQRLEARRATLLEAVRGELLQSDDERYLDLAGRVHDVADQGTADLLVDLNLASIDQHVEEIRDIEAALMRISEQSYGICEDCGDAIPLKRLNAYPTARRCVVCQEAYERTHVQKGQTQI